MKTIYTFTMDDRKEPSFNYANELRLLAFMLYDSIYNYYGDGKIPLDINDDIEYNKINEDKKNRIYKFDSELCDDVENVYYEPFLIGNNSFGITISDEDFNVNIIKQLLDENLRLLNIDCRVSISAFTYEAKDETDETNREMAIKAIFDKFGVKQKKPSFLDVFMRYGKHNRKGSHKR